jgi:hypothetical protein
MDGAVIPTALRRDAETTICANINQTIFLKLLDNFLHTCEAIG